MSILTFFENIFFPSLCVGCGNVGTYLCRQCEKKYIVYSVKQQCHVCKKNVKHGMVHRSCKRETVLDGVLVMACYSKFIEDYLGDIKYEFYFAMIPDLVRIMNTQLIKNSYFQAVVSNAVMTYVPLHSWRKRWRGFNQAEKIAAGLGKYWNVPVVRLLERKKRTKSQVGLSRKQRLRNVATAFDAVKSASEQKNTTVIIVDDVMTSGATLEGCAQVLRDQGIEQVFGLVFARG